MRLWLCRNKAGLTTYRLYNAKDVSHVPGWGWEARGKTKLLVELCAYSFQAATHFRLKPGEGPVEVEISITRKE